MNRVEVERNLRVSKGFVGPRNGFQNVRVHLAVGKSAPRLQRLVAVQHHYVDLGYWEKSNETRAADLAGLVKEGGGGIVMALMRPTNVVPF